MIMGIRSTTLVVGLCVVLASSAGYTEDSPFVGRWHWNPAASTLPPGAIPPKDVLNEISGAEAGTVTWSVTVVTPDDQRHVMTFKAGADGERIGSDTTVSASLSDDTLQTTFNGDGGQSDTLTCSVSANHSRLTCNGVLSDGLGHSVSYVDVYDRI